MRHLENYRVSLRNLAAEGIRTVVYNFMPVLDWVRTDLSYRLPDGSECLRFDPVHFAAFEVFLLKRRGAEADYSPEQLAAAEAFFHSMDAERSHQFAQKIIDSFPGCKMGFTLSDVLSLLEKYRGLDADRLREHYRLFLEAVVPTAEEVGVRLAVHPDDPPFSILGLPRIVCTEADLKTILEMVPSPSNGLCFCSGSFGVLKENDLPGMVQRLGHAIHAVHLRNIQHEPNGAYYEAGHLTGAVPMVSLMDALLKENLRRDEIAKLCFRPDHGHRILDDLAKEPNPNPGYDCLGRMRGLAELRGLQVGMIGRD